MAAVLEALTPQYKEECSKKVLAALLSEEERRTEERALHPIATLPEVCGCNCPN